MSLAGVKPPSAEELRQRHRAAIGVLPAYARQALRWLRRGNIITSPLLPLGARRMLLRAGGVRIDTMVSGLERCWFESEHVSIGDDVFVNGGCWFEGHGRIVIGRGSLLGPEVMIITSVHAFGSGGEVAREASYRDVTVGDGCWLGARAILLPGVSIGAGTVIAAGATVTKDCEPGAVYAGVPARRVR